MPTGLESIRVPLIDQPGQNLNLDFTLADTTETVAELRAENERLRKQLKRAELEREILKKATAYFAKEST